MAKFSGQLDRWGPLEFCCFLKFYIAVLGVWRGPIRLVAPWRFKMLDSQPDKSNMGPVSTDFHDLIIFQKGCHGFLARYLPCLRPGRSQVGFFSFSTGTKKLRSEKIYRFELVSPREVPSLTFSCPFKMSVLRSFLKAPPFFLSQFQESSVH